MRVVATPAILPWCAVAMRRRDTLIVIVMVGLIALAIGGFQWLSIGLCESDCASDTAREVWGTIAAAGALSAVLAIGALIAGLVDGSARRRSTRRDR
jgi:hypothetical protein